MDMKSKTATTKTAGFPNTDAPQAFREIAENGTKQAKETYEKMSAATTDTVDLIKNSYSMAFRTTTKSSSNLLTITSMPPSILSTGCAR